MIANLIVAMVAGLASALMFASTLSGALISLLLLFLAPLPLMVAALGWGPRFAAIGGISAAAGLGAIFDLSYCISFVVTVALPAWWLGHLVLLGRLATPTIAASSNAPPALPDLEWYPDGRILLWISGFAALITTAALLTHGTDAASITGALRQSLHVIFGPGDAASATEIEQWIDIFVTIAPAACTITLLPTLTLNLWLAAKITETSGRLHRPWPDLRAIALPPMTLAVLSAAIVFCFFGGLFSILAQILTAALIVAYALTGLAVLHTLTLGMKSRSLWLGFTYVIVVVFVWPVLAFVILGVADAVFGFRQRYLRKRPPPLPAS